MKKTALDPIIAFYLDSNSIASELGFTFYDFMKYDANSLESCHDFIQWVFPLKEPSQFNPNAPLVTQTTLDQFDDLYYIIQRRMNKAFARMYHFYFHNEKGYEWITPNNHNFLRITRIIKSQKLFSLWYNVDALYQNVNILYENKKFTDIIGPTTMNFWKEAYWS